MKLFSWLRRKKKKKESKKTIFGEDIEEEKDSSLEQVKENIGEVKKSFAFLNPLRRLNLGIALKLKRITAGLLFILYGIVSVMLFPDLAFVLFLATTIILLDYLWTTRSITWSKDQ